MEQRLAAGMSLETIGAEAGCHLSTVANWARRYGLQAANHELYAPKGGIGREVLAAVVAEGLSVREIAERLGRSSSTVGHWMRRYGLKTRRAELWALPTGARPPEITRECATHGLTGYRRTGTHGHYRCLRCRAARVAQRRRDVKAILVREAGGKCQRCGYDRWLGALQFHHLDPVQKEFNLALRGVARSLDRARAEAQKCALLCANCHAEVEAGLVAVSLE